MTVMLYWELKRAAQEGMPTNLNKLKQRLKEVQVEILPQRCEEPIETCRKQPLQ